MKKLIFSLIVVIFFGYLPVITQASAKAPKMEFQKRPPKPPKPPKPKSPKKPKPPPKPRKPPRPPR